MSYKNLLIVYILIVIFNLVNSKIFIGDVSVSPYRPFLKKQIFGPSIRPFLNEQNLIRRLEITRSILNSTTPIPSTTSTLKPIEINSKKQIQKTKNNYLEPILDLENTKLERWGENKRKEMSIENDHEIDVITYSSAESDEIDYNSVFEPISSPRRPQRTNFIDNTKKDKKIFYITRVIDLHQRPTFNNELYPIIKFVNQYKCDLNESTCGLYNVLDFKNKFNLDYIQNVNTKQRCLVADTDRAKQVNEFGARLATQYFHNFGLIDACLQIKYFVNGFIKMIRIDQQDKDTKNILEKNFLEPDYEINFKQMRSFKLPISLTNSPPRFFITVLLDREHFGRFGILGFNFTYDKCDSF